MPCSQTRCSQNWLGKASSQVGTDTAAICQDRGSHALMPGLYTLRCLAITRRTVYIGSDLIAGALSDEDLCTLVAEECGYVKS